MLPNPNRDPRILRLTKRAVETAPVATREYTLWDQEIRGFGCKITPRGKRVYVVFYRTREGAQRRPTLGAHGTLTCEQARDAARQMIVAALNGQDPSKERRDRRHAATVNELIERYINDYAKVHKKASSVLQDIRMLRRVVGPRFGAMKVLSVTRSDVMRLHAAMKDTPYEANRMLAVISKMFNVAELWGARQEGSNPVQLIKRYKEVPRDRYLRPEELSCLGAALTALEGQAEVARPVADAIRLLAMTGCRLREITSLQWPSVDLKRGAIDLPDAKTGPRLVALGEAAIGLLARTDRNEHPAVFQRPSGAPITKWMVEKAWKKLRSAAGISDIRVHDLRHTVGTYAGAAGFNAFVIRDLLGHKTLAMTSRYVGKDVAPLRNAADFVAERVSAALDPSSAEANPPDLSSAIRSKRRLISPVA